MSVKVEEKIMHQHQIITAITTDEMSDKIAKAMNDGWSLHGDLRFLGTTTWYQALVRYDSGPWMGPM